MSLRVHRDGGHTVLELLVAMSIFTTILAVIGSAILVMISDVRKSDNLSAANSSIRMVFSRLDKQVRYATAINRPVLVNGTDWYVEFATVDGHNAAICYQWRLLGATDALQERSWYGVPGTAPSFVTVATSVTNNPGTQPPFVFTPATLSVPVQQLTVNVIVARGPKSTATVNMTATFVARNTDTSTATNTDANGDGVSDSQVCQQGVGRP